jgi:hypothetical protein
MSTPRLSSERMRTLLGAARTDAPSPATRSKIWGKVSGSVGAPTAAGAGGAGAAKLLATGTLFGGALTVGLAAAVLFLRAAPGQAASALTTTTAYTAPYRSTAPSASSDSAGVINSASASSDSAGVINSPGDPAWLLRPVPIPVRPDRDPLAREAALVADARSALARNAPQAALRTIRATCAIAPRQLIPEELSVEAQALRTLGRTHEADTIEAVLRSRYPESALAR